MKRAIALLAAFGLAFAASAAPVQWTAASGGNDHWYEFVSDGSISWTSARTTALAQSHNGLSGYLATITSANENNFIFSQTGNSEAWIGASDQVVEGEWRWIDGPEAGQLFWLGSGSGTASGYSNWNTTRHPLPNPNNGGPGNEDWAHFFSDGTWNDRENSAAGGYIVEYSSLTPPLEAPEPGTLALLALGLAGLGYSRRKQ